MPVRACGWERSEARGSGRKWGEGREGKRGVGDILVYSWTARVSKRYHSLRRNQIVWASRFFVSRCNWEDEVGIPSVNEGKIKNCLFCSLEPNFLVRESGGVPPWYHLCNEVKDIAIFEKNGFYILKRFANILLNATASSRSVRNGNY